MSFEQKKWVTGAPFTASISDLMPRIESVLKSNQLSNNGPQLKLLEQSVAQMTGSTYCLAVANATLGLLLTLKALNIQGEVIVPSFTFAATATVLPWLQLTPVFADVDPFSHTLTPETIAPYINKNTGAILAVNTWGNMKYVKALEKFALQSNIPLVFDSAHALGCHIDGQPAGSFGDAEVFSLHATKFVHGLEGGLICTSNKKLAERIRALRHFGQQDNQLAFAGLNAKMNEVSALIAHHNLSYCDDFIRHNRKVYEAYKQELASVHGLALFSHGAGSNYQYIVLEVMPEFGIDADILQKVLQSLNIYTQRYFSPLHLSNAFRSEKSVSLPLTEALSSRTLVLPSGKSLDVKDVEYICCSIRQNARVNKIELESSNL